MSGTPRQLGGVTAGLLVVASMIGTGVFTTTGFLVRDLGSAWAVVAAWVIGGVAAMCGALSFAELTAALPDNGGEYQLLSKIYAPFVGFTSGVVSFVVGFAAPIAASAIAFGQYFGRVVGLPDESPWITISGVALIVVASGLHSLRVSVGSGFQNVLTAVKVALIAVFIAGGLALGDLSRLGAEGTRSLGDALISDELAVGLVFVAFAYSGWNAAAYVAGEVEVPQRTLPLALLAGTGLVTLIYVTLNVVFLAAAPMSALSGRVEVGHVAATALFGESAARVLSLIIALGLISTIGALVMTGPRVYEAMGRDYPALRLLARRTGDGAPAIGVVIQAVLAILMAVTASFDALLEYVGFTLSLFAALTVSGVLVLRARQPDLPRPYRTWGYPFTPILFVALSLWMAIHSMLSSAFVGIVGAATIAGGLVLYLVLRGSRPSRPA